MTCIINASTSNNLQMTSDGSGIVKVQSNGVTTNALAWVNFNGTSSTPITPRASYNVSSVTKNGTGDYTLNFANALTDANYAILVTGTYGSANNFNGTAPTTTAARISTYATTTAANQDSAYIGVAVFGN